MQKASWTQSPLACYRKSVHVLSCEPLEGTRRKINFSFFVELGWRWAHTVDVMNLLAFEHPGIVQHESADEAGPVAVRVSLQCHLTEGLPESSCTRHTYRFTQLMQALCCRYIVWKRTWHRLNHYYVGTCVCVCERERIVTMTEAPE